MPNLKTRISIGLPAISTNGEGEEVITPTTKSRWAEVSSYAPRWATTLDNPRQVLSVTVTLRRETTLNDTTNPKGITVTFGGKTYNVQTIAPAKEAGYIVLTLSLN